MRVLARLGIATAACAVLAAPLTAQRSDRGWIGISLDFSTDRGGRRTLVEISEVVPGSPADAAGLRVGDRVLSVNDLRRPSELQELAERLHLEPGDRVVMTVERSGRRREVRVRAGEWPRDFVGATRLTWSFEPDSMVETMVRAMDSLRVQLVQGRTPGSPPGQGSSRQGIRVVTSSGERATVQAPFEFFVFRSEEHDSLRQAMEDLNRDIEGLERRMSARGRELQRANGAVSQVRLAQDAEFSRLQSEMEAAARRSATLRTAMADAARETAGFEYALPAAPTVDERQARRERGQERAVEEFRPLTPYLLGRNRVAGAEVIDLRPELAAYFQGVEAGVLVVDVAPRTPAAISGIVPGDVITRMDQVAVRSVDDLRFGVSRAGDTLPITLIRRGARIQVLLRR